MAHFKAFVDKQNCLNIAITGRFDFNVIPEFRSLYERHKVMPQAYVIDMQHTSTIDSSALGMLLMLRRHAGGDQSNIVIKNLNQDLKQIFKVSKLDTMFHLE